jgi:hypothetical protein
MPGYSLNCTLWWCIFQAHAGYADLHDLNLEGVNLETSMQVSIFLNRLGGSKIGLTAMRMFVVDKPTMLTVRFDRYTLDKIHYYKKCDDYAHLTLLDMAVIFAKLTCVHSSKARWHVICNNIYFVLMILIIRMIPYLVVKSCLWYVFLYLWESKDIHSRNYLKSM